MGFQIDPKGLISFIQRKILSKIGKEITVAALYILCCNVFRGDEWSDKGIYVSFLMLNFIFFLKASHLFQRCDAKVAPCLSRRFRHPKRSDIISYESCFSQKWMNHYTTKSPPKAQTNGANQGSYRGSPLYRGSPFGFCGRRAWKNSNLSAGDLSNEKISP